MQVIFSRILREAVAKAIHLLGVDGVNLEAALDQRLDHGAMRRLDRNVDLTGIGSTAHLQHCLQRFGQALHDIAGLVDLAALDRRVADRKSFGSLWKAPWRSR